MEGNACYKFSTIRNYVRAGAARPIRVILDIGANVGAITREILTYFPDAHIYAFEPVQEYYLVAQAALRNFPWAKIFNAAVTSRHRYSDDFGDCPRAAPASLQILKGLPAGGPGWQGGSQVVSPSASYDPNCYVPIGEPVVALTLDEVVAFVLALEGATQVDLVKFDCEGCEHSSLGCSKIETLRQLRFIVGEYHNITQFYQVVERKLFQTHFVNLIGNATLGAFFAENKDEGAGILEPSRDGVLSERPWLNDTPMEWNVFSGKFIPPGEEVTYAYALGELGLTSAPIAARIGSPVDEVELILGLRQARR